MSNPNRSFHAQIKLSYFSFLMRYSCSGTTGRKVKGKGKGHPRTGHEGPEGEQIYSSTLPSTSALDGGGWSAPRPGRFTAGKDPLPIVQEVGWVLGPLWTGAENLTPTGIRSPDRPARSESLYRLGYPGRYRKECRNMKIIAHVNQ